jgi:anti-sigma B factor antagonist
VHAVSLRSLQLIARPVRTVIQVAPDPGDETKDESVDPNPGSAMSVREGEAGVSGLSSPTGSTTPTIHCSAPSAVSCWNLGIEAGPVGNIVVVRVAGDIDTLTLPLVWGAVITALDNHPADLVVDISEVGFCGVRGFALLAAIARVTTAGGIGYTISGLGRHHERAAYLLWPDQQFPHARSTSAAVTAIREDQALRLPRSHGAKSSRYAPSRRPQEGAAAQDRSPRRTGGPDGRHLPSAPLGRLRLRLLGAVAIVRSSVSGEGCEQVARR